MKSKIQPIDNEVSLSADEFIVSKTNTKGVITYINRTFMEISGYTEPDLLGIQHNIIRHPDMPRGVFKQLWNTLKAGEEFFGYVKNMCEDGSYYWVFANITPDFDDKDQLRGYYSVRRKPTAQAIETIIPIYQKMLDIECSSSLKDAPKKSMAYLDETISALGTDYQSFVLSLDEGNTDGKK